jgi:hypothetical protein
MTTKTFGVYVVRVWLEPTSDGLGVWRASVTDTNTKEKNYFSEPSQLSRFLTALELPPEHPLLE